MAKSKKLVCPKCGWDGIADGNWDSWFRYVEDVTLAKRVEGLDDGGHLEVDAEERVESYGDPAKARLRCGDCNEEFPVPDGLEVVFR